MTSATDGTVNNVLQTLDPAEIERELLQHWARLQDPSTPIVQELYRFIALCSCEWIYRVPPPIRRKSATTESMAPLDMLMIMMRGNTGGVLFFSLVLVLVLVVERYRRHHKAGPSHACSRPGWTTLRHSGCFSVGW